MAPACARLAPAGNVSYKQPMRRLVVWIAVVSMAGCQWMGGGGERGSGVAKTEAREVPSFTKLALEGALDAEISVGGAQHVELSGDDNLLPLMLTEVNNQRLRIAPKQSIRPKLEMRARVTAPALAALSASGSTDIELHGLDADTFDLDTSGSADVSAAGHARALTIHVSGSGSIDAHDLTAQHVTVVVSGSGDLEVNATDVLDVTISGSGSVRYHGHPRDVRKSISGSGSIEPL